MGVLEASRNAVSDDAFSQLFKKLISAGQKNHVPWFHEISCRGFTIHRYISNAHDSQDAAVKHGGGSVEKGALESMMVFRILYICFNYLQSPGYIQKRLYSCASN